MLRKEQPWKDFRRQVSGDKSSDYLNYEKNKTSSSASKVGHLNN